MTDDRITIRLGDMKDRLVAEAQAQSLELSNLLRNILAAHLRGEKAIARASFEAVCVWGYYRAKKNPDSGEWEHDSTCPPRLENSTLTIEELSRTACKVCPVRAAAERRIGNAYHGKRDSYRDEAFRFSKGEEFPGGIPLKCPECGIKFPADFFSTLRNHRIQRHGLTYEAAGLDAISRESH